MARKLKALSESPQNREKRQEWADHNDLKGIKGNTRPLFSFTDMS